MPPRLLDLPATVRDEVDAGRLSARITCEIVTLGDFEAQKVLTARAIVEHLSRS